MVLTTLPARFLILIIDGSPCPWWASASVTLYLSVAVRPLRITDAAEADVIGLTRVG